MFHQILLWIYGLQSFCIASQINLCHIASQINFDFAKFQEH